MMALARALTSPGTRRTVDRPSNLSRRGRTAQQSGEPTPEADACRGTAPAGARRRAARAGRSAPQLPAEQRRQSLRLPPRAAALSALLEALGASCSLGDARGDREAFLF